MKRHRERARDEAAVELPRERDEALADDLNSPPFAKRVSSASELFRVVSPDPRLEPAQQRIAAKLPDQVAGGITGDRPEQNRRWGRPRRSTIRLRPSRLRRITSVSRPAPASPAFQIDHHDEDGDCAASGLDKAPRSPSLHARSQAPVPLDCRVRHFECRTRRAESRPCRTLTCVMAFASEHAVTSCVMICVPARKAMLKRILLLLAETESSTAARDYAFKLAQEAGAKWLALPGSTCHRLRCGWFGASASPPSGKETRGRTEGEGGADAPDAA